MWDGTQRPLEPAWPQNERESDFWDNGSSTLDFLFVPHKFMLMAIKNIFVIRKMCEFRRSWPKTLTYLLSWTKNGQALPSWLVAPLLLWFIPRESFCRTMWSLSRRQAFARGTQINDNYTELRRLENPLLLLPASTDSLFPLTLFIRFPSREGNSDTIIFSVASNNTLKKDAG